MSQPRLPTLIVAILGLVCAGLSLWLSTFLIEGCIDWFAFRNAVDADATLLNVDRRFVHSGDGMAERMTVRYRYVFEGLEYETESDRLSLFAKSEYMFDPIEKAYHSGRKVRCYVDPDNPARSFFSIHFSVPLFLLSLLFPVCFGGIAVIMSIELRSRIRRTQTADA